MRTPNPRSVVGRSKPNPDSRSQRKGPAAEAGWLPGSPSHLASDLTPPFLQMDATRRFFSAVTERIPPFRGAFIIVAHVLPTLLPLLEALSSIGRIAAVVAKPRSIDHQTLSRVQASHRVLHVDRKTLVASEYLQSSLLPTLGTENVIILDVGGYFAGALGCLHEALGDRLLGVVEDTENGHQKYAAVPSHSVQIASVARSLSKRYEDRWVGQAIIYSAEAIVRNAGTTLIGKRPYVIGFGKIGQSIAHNLKNRGLNVTIWDLDSHQRLYARCKDFLVATKSHGLRECDLVFCATGNKALTGTDFSLIRPGAVVFSATSADDELDLSGLAAYQSSEAGFALTRYSSGAQHFFLANNGNAVNFLHGAEVRPYIHLVQAAILIGIRQIVSRDIPPGSIQGLTREDEGIVADIFEQCFFPLTD
jgi:adenosylhomocysteinase